MSLLDVLLRGYATIKIAGVEYPARQVINFLTGVSATDNPTDGSTDITFSAGATPTGTGFRKVVANVEQGVAAQVNLASSSDVTGTAPYANLPAGLGLFHTVRVVATGNVASLSGTGSSVDGQTLAAGDRVLLTAQSTASQNGIWVVASGSWTRPADWSSASGSPPLAEAWIAVSEGTTYAHTIWRVSTQGTITVGTTSVTIAQLTTLAPNATTGAVGLVQLAHSLGGTATNPTVTQVDGDGTGKATITATIGEWQSTSANSKCRSLIFNVTTSATTANQTLATIPITASSGINQLDVLIVGRQGANAYKTALDTSYLDNGSGPAIMGSDSTDTNPKTAGSTGTPAINSSVSGQNVLIRGTPWTSTSTTWTVIVTQTVAT